MGYLIEFILELIFEFGVEASQNKKVPKIIRYLLIFIISFVFLAVISLIIFTGILILSENIIGGIIFIVLGLIMFVSAIIKFKKLYLVKKETIASNKLEG